MRVRMPLAAIALLLGLVASGCTSSDPKGDPPPALPSPTQSAGPELCGRDIHFGNVVHEVPTTVGDVRDWNAPGEVKPNRYADYSPGADPAEPAAWCWVESESDTYTIIVVGPRGADDAIMVGFLPVSAGPIGIPDFGGVD